MKRRTAVMIFGDVGDRLTSVRRQCNQRACHLGLKPPLRYFIYSTPQYNTLKHV